LNKIKIQSLIYKNKGQMKLIKPSYQILTKIDNNTILQDLEKIGRICYKSEDKITNESAPKFCKMILGRNHESVIEHISLSVKFIIDRGVSHELVRHRLCSFSQESTRYCNYKGGVTFIIPPWVKISEGEYLQTPNEYLYDADYIWMTQCLDAEKKYQQLLHFGWNPQQARSILPNSLKTEIITTANIRQWRHILKLRTNKSAHPQMLEIMKPLLEDLQKQIPIIFEDINDDQRRNM
jgi:thymidylate synthase (FAD)